MYNMHRKTHYDHNPYKGKKNITNIKRQCPKYFLPNYKDLIKNIDVQRSEIETRARRTEKNINFYTLTAQHNKIYEVKKENILKKWMILKTALKKR